MLNGILNVSTLSQKNNNLVQEDTFDEMIQHVSSRSQALMNNQCTFEQMLRLNQVLCQLVNSSSTNKLKEIYIKTNLEDLIWFTLKWHIMSDKRIDILSKEM